MVDYLPSCQEKVKVVTIRSYYYLFVKKILMFMEAQF